MPLVIEWAGGSLLLEEDRSAVVGRDVDVDVVIEHRQVSRHHLALQFESGVWRARDLGSSRGTYRGDKSVVSVELTEVVVLHLGSEVGPTLTLTPVGEGRRKNSGGSLAVSRGKRAEAASSRIVLGTRLRIGRDESNDLVLDDHLISRFHAEITTRDGSAFDLVDLGGANGTFVNAHAVRRHRLMAGDLIAIGNIQYRYAPGALEPVEATGGFRYSVNHISVDIRGRRLLDEVSFELKPRSLTAVVGPSGAGKSTLLDVLTGRRIPSHGSVVFAGMDLHANYEGTRQRLGFVPQADLLHTSLTPRRALRYGADLRFSRDFNREQRHEAVERVMNDLGLAERAELRIDSLSGGQRKRVSVALELLTEPDLLFLDEPTSGLDPGLDRQVMNLLRRLADEGRTVLVVTHSTANLDVCDDVVVLAPGGRLAYFGSPHTVLRALDADDWSEAFDQIGRMPPPATTGATAATRAIETHESKPTAVRSPGWLAQWATVVRRYLAVIGSDRPYLLLLSILPLLLAGVGYTVGSDDGLGPGGSEEGGLNIQARSLILILLLGTVFMGAAIAVQELVKERAIFQREKSTGLSASAYLASKLVVLGSIALVQAVIFVALSLIGRSYPEEALATAWVFADVVVPIAALAVISMIVGLIVSLIIRTTETAMPALVLVTMGFIVLSGAVPLRYDGILEWLGPLNPAYWAMNALASAVDLNTLLGLSGEAEVTEWVSDPSRWAISLALLGLVGFLLLAILTIASVLRSGRR